MTDTQNLTILGIETSCDETAASIVRGNPGAGGEILSNVVFSQLEEHAPYGGVVPEIAARAHIDRLDALTAQALQEAGLGFEQLDGIAATAGPGLIGGVIVGLMTAKGMAAASGLPFLPVNHLEGHALTVRLSNNVPFPYLLLLVSGGHCQLLIVEGLGQYRQLGTTIDDAVGEAFDKTAKMLGLGYPGGPAVEQAALRGDGKRFNLPRPLKGRPGCDFSFSGLKTAVRQAAAGLGELGELADQDKADLSASFQAAVCDSLSNRTTRAMEIFCSEFGVRANHFVLAGGVAANSAIRKTMAQLAETHGLELVVPPIDLCTDNGAMIAWAGLEQLSLEKTTKERSSGRMEALAAPPRARWPLASKLAADR